MKWSTENDADLMACIWFLGLEPARQLTQRSYMQRGSSILDSIYYANRDIAAALWECTPEEWRALKACGYADVICEMKS